MMDVERIVGLLAAIVISLAQIIYVINCLRRKITPSVLSWFGWACLMGTSSCLADRTYGMAVEYDGDCEFYGGMPGDRGGGMAERKLFISAG